MPITYAIAYAIWRLFWMHRRYNLWNVKNSFMIQGFNFLIFEVRIFILSINSNWFFFNKKCHRVNPPTGTNRLILKLFLVVSLPPDTKLERKNDAKKKWPLCWNGELVTIMWSCPASGMTEFFLRLFISCKRPYIGFFTTPFFSLEVNSAEGNRIRIAREIKRILPLFCCHLHTSTISAQVSYMNEALINSFWQDKCFRYFSI